MAYLVQESELSVYKDSFVFTPTSQQPRGREPSLRIHRTSGEIDSIEPTPPSSSGKPSKSSSKEKVLKTYQVYGIFGVFTLQAGQYLAVISERQMMGTIQGHNVYRVAKVSIIAYHPNPNAALNEQQRKDEATYLRVVESLLNDRNFYFSYTLDLTTTTQRRITRSDEHSAIPLHLLANPQFFWNAHMLSPLLGTRFNAWILPVLRGYVQISILMVQGLAFDFVLVSRRSARRAGTRYLTRGVDEHGSVANYVETEQILGMNGHWTAFVQTRGSIPLFWGQTSSALKYNPAAVITHSRAETIKAFCLHFVHELAAYKKQLIVNLLDRKGDELTLSEAFESYISNHCDSEVVDYIAFDFHAFCRNNQFENVSLLMDKCSDRLAAIGFLKFSDRTVERMQDGCVRTNCLDCLDRTNLVQSTFATRSLLVQLQSFGIMEFDEPSIFDLAIKNAWANNGDAISFQYAGTKALKSDFTRTGKRKTQGKVSDGVKSISRFVINNFWDGLRQVAIDLVLGNVRVETLNMSLLEQEERAVVGSSASSSTALPVEQIHLDIADE